MEYKIFEMPSEAEMSQSIELTKRNVRWSGLLKEESEKTAPRPQASAKSQPTFFFASTWARGAARFIDAFILLLIFAYTLVFISNGTELIQLALAGEGFRLPYELILGFLVFRWTYLTLCLGLFGATPGKRLFGLRVVSFTETPHELSWDNLLARVLLMDFGFVVLGHTLLVAAFFRRDRRHLFDIATGTIVVQTTRRPKPKLRVVFGGLLLLYSILSLPGHVALYRCLHWSPTGVTVHVAPPPAQFLVNR